MIVVVSSVDDDHATAVLARLRRGGADAHLIDLAALPQSARLAIGYGARQGCRGSVWSTPGGELAVGDADVVWWRRPQPFAPDPAVTDPDHHRFILAECWSAVSGLWLTLDADWINHPSRDEEAARKPYQLRLAPEVGLEIPRTVITNDPDEARRFVDQVGHERTVYKAFTGTLETWRETRVLRAGEVEQLDAVRHAPVIFQEFVPAVRDLRVTVIGERIFASAIDSSAVDYQVDYRMDLARAEVEPHSLPAAVEQAIHRLMARLGLVYGAIDLRLTPDGRYVFLEINPAGQWLFMEERTDQPITDAFVAELREREGRQREKKAAAAPAVGAAA